jgi:hypothetical protein
MVDMEPDASPPLLADPHFYWGACALCHACTTQSRPLLRCTRCRAMAYCSKVERYWDVVKLFVFLTTYLLKFKVGF